MLKGAFHPNYRRKKRTIVSLLVVSRRHLYEISVSECETVMEVNSILFEHSKHLKILCAFPKAILWLLWSTDFAVRSFHWDDLFGWKQFQWKLFTASSVETNDAVYQIWFFNSQRTTNKIPLTYTEIGCSHDISNLCKCDQNFTICPKVCGHPSFLNDMVSTYFWPYYSIQRYLWQQCAYIFGEGFSCLAHVAQSEVCAEMVFRGRCGRTWQNPDLHPIKHHWDELSARGTGETPCSLPEMISNHLWV